MITRKFLLFIFIVYMISNKNCYGQNFPYKNITTDQGLSNSNIYDIKQDTKGLLYIATDNGLCIYDGTTFKNYFQSDGLADNSLTGIMIKNDTTVYIGTFKKGLSIFQKGKFTNKLFDDSIGYVYDQIYTYKNKLFIGRSRKYLRVIEGNRTVSQLYSINEENSESTTWINRIIQTKDSTIILACENGLFYIDNVTKKKFTGSTVFNEPIDELFKDKQNNIWFSTKNKVYCLINGKPELRFTVEKDHIILRFVIDDYGNLWYYNFADALIIYRKDGTKIKTNLLSIKSCNIQCMMVDRDGSVWLGTNGKGLFHFYNLYIKHYNENNNLSNNFITKVLKDTVSNTLLIGTQNKLNLLKNNEIISIDFGVKILAVEDIAYSSNNTFGCGLSMRARKSVVVNSNFGPKIFNFIAKSITSSPNGKLLFCASDGTDTITSMHLENDKVKQEFFTHIKQLTKVRKLFLDKKQTLWISSDLGIFCRTKNGFVSGPILNRITKERIRDIKESKTGDIWMCSQSGLAIISGNKWKLINHLNNQEFTNIRAIEFDDKNRAWIGTLNGVVVIENGRIKKITKEEGIIANEINCLFYERNDNTMWIGTSDGLTELNIDQFDHQKFNKATIDLLSVMYGNQLIQGDKTFDLPEFDQPLKINFQSINFISPKKNRIKYRLDRSEWTEGMGTFIEFVYFPYGKHQIEVQIGSDQLGWSDPYILNFNRKTPFFKSNLFYALILMIIIIGGSMLMYFRINMVNRRNTEKIAINKRISELKQQAFGASMNPHFIFNALSSVQYFINNNRNEEANNYLIKLSRLIRLNLNAINKSFITIEEELEKLEYYISLEKMRFSNKINFIVNVDPLLDKNTTLIPNMILQPFIENALWHGLLPSSNKEGMIKVDFLRTQEAIIITIRDNGIGLKAAKQNKQTNHVSKGISLIANRLEILDNPINSLEIVDLLDGFGNCDGTLVTLSIAHYFLPLDSGNE